MVVSKERTEQRLLGNKHTFDDCDLAKLGTHSFKRTGVTLLKDVCRSTAVVAAVAGTTARTLDRIYDCPTAKRQRRAVAEAFEDIVGSIDTVGNATGATSSTAGRPTGAKFCSMCGQARGERAWVCCPFCGHRY